MRGEGGFPFNLGAKIRPGGKKREERSAARKLGHSLEQRTLYEIRKFLIDDSVLSCGASRKN